jgi:pimeloyl-ACP methyl ester carboxylesterase
MPFEVGTFVDGDLELSYEVYGSGRRVLVYLHGLLMDVYLNRRLATDLGDHGYRVVLVDLPGHGASGKPRHASAHRIDAYAFHIIRLLDELQLDQVALGGVSLGASVTLEAALVAPERLLGLVLEMPVLENAAPAAALFFGPVLLASHYAAPVLRVYSRLLRRVGRHRLGPLGPYASPLLLDPDEIASVLHGLLVGPLAPTAEQRAALDIPALVIGHCADRLHPFADAAKLAGQLPRAELVQARSVLELRLRPQRLTEEILTFLDRLWSQPRPGDRRMAG